MGGRRKWFLDKKSSGIAKKERGEKRFQVIFRDRNGQKTDVTVGGMCLPAKAFFVGESLPTWVTGRGDRVTVSEC